MRGSKFSRRDVLIGSSALAAGAASRRRSCRPRRRRAPITPAADRGGQEGRQGRLVHLGRPAAGREDRQGLRGEISRHRRAGRAHRRRARVPAHRPGIRAATSTRSTWSTRRTPRISSSGSDDGMLAPYVPEDVAKFYPAEHKDPDGMFASFRVWLCIIAYNTNLVKKEEAPKSFADLLDPKWKGKIVKAHPGYSGTIMTATYQITRDLGWEYFEKLAKQNIMQVQSAADPPKKLALGERAVHGRRQRIQHLPATRRRASRSRPSMPTEGTPLIVGPNGDVQGRAESERRAAVPELHVHAGMPAAHHRCRRPALGASARPRKKPGVRRSSEIKADEGRSPRPSKNERRDQGALRQDIPRLTV